MPEHETRERLHRRVLDALFWGGDTAAGAEAARELARYADAPPARSDEDREAQWRDICVEQQWRLAHGDSASTRAAIGRRRSVAENSLCATVLEAWLATIGKRSDAALLLDRLDSLLLTGKGDSPTLPPNLIVARLREEVGDSRGALAAIRRRTYGLGPPWFRSTYLREEGRLSALTGDTVGAIAAYRNYLALRSEPEPGLKSEVERVRTELAALVAEPL